MGALLEEHAGESLETGEVGYLGNVRETTAVRIVIESVDVTRGRKRTTEERARYLTEEVEVEFGAWERRFGEEILGVPESWTRYECHAKRGELQPGDTLVLAEFPFAARRRCSRATFRPGLHNHRPPHFGEEFLSRIRRARDELQGDVPALAKTALEDPEIVRLDPFNTGRSKLVAGISTPAPHFGEEPRGHSRPAGQGELGRTGWVLGACRDVEKVHQLVQLELWELISRGGRKNPVDGAFGSGHDGLRVARAPWNTKAGPRTLSDEVRFKAESEFLEYAAWQAMAGPGPGESMPEDRSVGDVAFRRLNDLLYNLQRRVDRAAKYR